MKKKFLVFALATTMAVGVSGALAGCSSCSSCSAYMFDTYFDVASVDDLKEAETNSIKKIRLTADIDFDYETITGITGSTFDGQGHTIKNACYSSTREESSLFGSVNEIKNVTFENITVTAENAYYTSILCTRAETIDNVHIKNCTLTVTATTKHYCYVGAIYGDYYMNDLNNSDDCVISNCTVENTTIEVTGAEESIMEMYVGGIAARDTSISNCSVTNCTITATSQHYTSDPYVGGIVGYSEGDVVNCYAKSNTLTSSATWYHKAYGIYSTAEAYIGGIVAHSLTSGKIEYCYAEDNTITAKSSGDVFAGGLAGLVNGNPVSQCYTKNNTIQMTSGVDAEKRRIGGLIGCAMANTISSCWAYNETTLEETSSITDENASVVAGFIATGTATISNCASFTTTLKAGSTMDEFCTGMAELSECYISSSKYGNCKSLELVSEAFWITPSEMKERLNLLGGYWQFNNDELPSLVFSS